MKQRLTVHVKGAKVVKEKRKNKSGEMVDVPVIKNTLAYEINNSSEVSGILKRIQSDGLEVTKHYLSNIN
jgi:hypothetical protein